MSARVLERIGHINIRTAAFEETLDFYARLLDLRRGEAATMLDQDRNAWLFDDEGRAVIHVNMPEPGEAVPAPAGPLDHVAFDCDDLEAMRARLKAMGVAHVERASARVAGLTQVTLKDPNGVKLELAFGARAAWRRVDPAVRRPGDVAAS